MKVKEYNLVKNIKKTADANNLVFINDAVDALMDLSLLKDTGLPSDELEVIATAMANHHVFYEEFDIWYPTLDDYTWYEVRAQFAPHRVFSAKTCKRLYTISEAVRVKITRMHRDSIYDQLAKDVRIYEARNYHNAPMEDIEI